MQLYTELHVTKDDILRLLKEMSGDREWKRQWKKVEKLVNRVMEAIRNGQRGKQVYLDMLKAGELKNFPINRWLSLREPDKLPLHKMKYYRDGTTDVGDYHHEFNNMKRWFFMFLNVLSGNTLSDIYFDAKEQRWVIKGIDPRYRDAMDICVGVVVLDSTANKDLLESIFGVRPYVVSSEGDPYANVNIRMVHGFHNTYKSTMFKDNYKHVRAKMNWINSDMRDRGRNGGVITYKQLLGKAFEPDWDPELDKGYWFCDERASNRFYEQGNDTLYLMGIPTPNIDATAAELDSDGDLAATLVARPFMKRSDGVMDYIIMKDFGYKPLRDLLWYKKASGYIQALGRLRSLRREYEHLELVVMDTMALPFPINEIINVDENEREMRLDLAGDEVNRQVTYLKHLILSLQKVASEFDGQLTFGAMQKLSRLIEEGALRQYGVNITTCPTFEAVYEVIENRIAYIRANPKTVITPATITQEDFNEDLVDELGNNDALIDFNKAKRKKSNERFG
jgi:hypothetical protein